MPSRRSTSCWRCADAARARRRGVDGRLQCVGRLAAVLAHLPQAARRQQHRDRRQQPLQAPLRVLAAPASIGVDQVDPERSVVVGQVDAGERGRQRPERSQLRVDRGPRHHDEFDVELSLAAAPQQPVAVAHVADGERCLPVDLEAEHVVQAVGRGLGQLHAPAQAGAGRQQQPARRLGQPVAQQRRQRVAGRRGQFGQRQLREFPDPSRLVQGQAQDLALRLQQQPAAGQTERLAHARRQPGRERRAPPGERGAGPGPCASIGAPATARRRRRGRWCGCCGCCGHHRGEAPSSQRSTL
ncbi:hypothetical protein [Luteimonas sp. FCS-9]|uniref:hypothetical protein n=1 Tax=Luteimonas sp. FCS-9 TaxID=1547516 RepID=UPI001E3E6E5C|nr:hypothetical protein [Luteimonas sp. FCS-9]